VVRIKALASREEAHWSQFMQDEIRNKIDGAVGKRRAELQVMSLEEVGRAFQFKFGIRPDLAAGKDNLIERVLVKVRAELERNA